MAKPGPKKRIWTDVERSLVKYMALAGVPHDRIAKRLSTTGDTLRKNFRDELDFGADDMAALAVGKLAQNIREGKEASIFFYLKTQRGWRETNVLEVEHTVEYVDRPAPLDQDAWLSQYEKKVLN